MEEVYLKYSDATRDRDKYPHCDSNILHAPKECKYCDMSPELQQLREEMEINFTGHYDKDKAICPAETKRNLPTIELWYGNVPRP